MEGKLGNLLGLPVVKKIQIRHIRFVLAFQLVFGTYCEKHLNAVVAPPANEGYLVQSEQHQLQSQGHRESSRSTWSKEFQRIQHNIGFLKHSTPTWEQGAHWENLVIHHRGRCQRGRRSHGGVAELHGCLNNTNFTRKKNNIAAEKRFNNQN